MQKQESSQGQGKEDPRFHQGEEYAEGIGLVPGAAFPECVVFGHGVRVVPVGFGGKVEDLHYRHPVDKLHDGGIEFT